jgi:hypothetical protein
MRKILFSLLLFSLAGNVFAQLQAYDTAGVKKWLRVDTNGYPIITGSIALPSGTSTSANQTTLITNQTSGGQKTQVVYTVSTSVATFDSAATASDTTDLGSVKEVLGFFASSTFDSSAVTMDINLSGTALYSVWSETARFSVNLDSSGLVYFDSPIIARKVKLNFTAQNSAASITLIYK